MTSFLIDSPITTTIPAAIPAALPTVPAPAGPSQAAPSEAAPTVASPPPVRAGVGVAASLGRRLRRFAAACSLGDTALSEHTLSQFSQRDRLGERR